MPSTAGPRPVAVVLCLAAAAILAVPTLVLPADSTTDSQTVYVVVGSVLLIAGMVRLRLEIADPRPEPPTEGTRPASGRNGESSGLADDHGEGLGGDVPHD